MARKAKASQLKKPVATTPAKIEDLPVTQVETPAKNPVSQTEKAPETTTNQP